MVGSKNYVDFLIQLIKNCEYYDLTEKQSLELINKKLSKPISRSTYYSYKKKLYQDEKFQSLKKSPYNSKMLKSLMLYMDDDMDNSDDLDFNKLIYKQFPEKRDVFHVTDELYDKDSRLHDKVKSTFCIPNYSSKTNMINLPRLVGLPKNYTTREEYVLCGKEKTNECESLQHGPYYYAYWREKVPNENKTVLRKKYLGTIDPRLQPKINYKI